MLGKSLLTSGDVGHLVNACPHCMQEGGILNMCLTVWYISAEQVVTALLMKATS
jgi:hypothetical protein